MREEKCGAVIVWDDGGETWDGGKWRREEEGKNVDLKEEEENLGLGE